MTSVFLSISVLCLWVYVLMKEHRDNKRHKETLGVMKQMWDFEKHLCDKLIESNRVNNTNINSLANRIDEHVNNKSIHVVHYEIKTFSTEEDKNDKNN